MPLPFSAALLRQARARPPTSTALGMPGTGAAAAASHSPQKDCAVLHADIALLLYSGDFLRQSAKLDMVFCVSAISILTVFHSSRILGG